MEFLEEMREYGADVDGTMERLIGDEELYKEFLKMFIADDSFDNLEKNLKTEDYEQIFEAAHTLKGLSGNLGLTPMFDAICVIVEAVRNKKYENLSSGYKIVLREKARLEDIAGRL